MANPTSLSHKPARPLSAPRTSRRLENLKKQHRALDTLIKQTEAAHPLHPRLAEFKRTKLALKDNIAALEATLKPRALAPAPAPRKPAVLAAPQASAA